MNRTSVCIHSLLNEYCNAENISRIVGNSYFENLILNFDEGFGHYLQRHYHVRIMSYRQVELQLYSHNKVSVRDRDLCVYHTDTYSYRFLEKRDINVIKAIIRKYYQDSNEINLRIRLLFDSKLGTRYLSNKTGVPCELITKARHGFIPINDIDAEQRLTLENFYLNSELAVHIRRLRVHFG